MAETATLPESKLRPVGAEAFLADRQAFWGSFTHFVTGGVIAVVVLLILMAIFLV